MIFNHFLLYIHIKGYTAIKGADVTQVLWTPGAMTVQKSQYRLDLHILYF